jgi:hypothetical protein
MKGATQNSAAAPNAVDEDSSVDRTRYQKATTATAPNTGPPNHAAPTSTPGRSISGPPGGNCENTRPLTSTTWSALKNSGCASAIRAR